MLLALFDHRRCQYCRSSLEKAFFLVIWTLKKVFLQQASRLLFFKHAEPLLFRKPHHMSFNFDSQVLNQARENISSSLKVQSLVDQSS